jgi:hypothetical protein
VIRKERKTHEWEGKCRLEYNRQKDSIGSYGHYEKRQIERIDLLDKLDHSTLTSFEVQILEE